MGVTYKLSDEEKKRAGRFLEIIQEQKETDSKVSTNQNMKLPIANKQVNNILPNVRLATDEEKKIKQKIINKSSVIDKIGYVGKKGLTGLASGTAGIAQAGLTDVANNLQKGNSKSGTEVANNMLESTMGLFNPLQGYNKYIKNLPNMIGNVIKTVKNKDTNAIEKVASLGTTAVSDALSNNVARDVLNSGVQLAGKVLPSNANEKILEVNNRISEPIQKINQDLYIEGQNYDKATQFIGDATQSVGNMIPSIATTAITKNPNIGLLTMGISAKGQSTQEAMNKGATLDEAIKIGDTKGAIEVATEMLTGGVNIFGRGALDDIVEKGIKDKIKSKVGKYLLQKGYQLGGEVLEETISDVLGTVIDKGTVDPNATYSIEDWGDTAVTTILSTIILNSITGGMGRIKKYNNYDYNTQQRLQEAQDIIDNINNENNILNTQQGQPNTYNNTQNQQVTPLQNKIAQNEISEQINNSIANNQETLYNNIESESGINEGIYSRTIGRDGRIENEIANQRRKTNDTTIGKDNISKDFKENRQRSYEEFIDYANKNKIELDTAETKRIKELANNLGINVTLFNGNGSSDYIGMTNKQNPDNVYIDINQKEIRGEDMLYHEFLHSRKRNNDSIYIDKIAPIEQDIVQNYTDIINSFVEEKGLDKRYINYPELIAEEIIADYTSKHLGKLEIDYNLPQFYIETINQSVDEMINNIKNTKKNINSKADILTSKANNENSFTERESINWNKIERPEGKFRKHYRSIIESSNTTLEAKKIAKEVMGQDTYIPDSNTKQLEKADERISMSGADAELKSMMSKTINNEKITAVDVAVGERLIEYYSKIGDAQKLQDAIQTTAMVGTQLGQAVQAMSILNHQTPQGQVVWIQRSIDKMNNELRQKRGETAPQFNLTDNMIERILHSENEQQMSQNLDVVYKELGQQVHKSTIEQLDSWRYFAMLGNFRTHIRNMTGNFLMGTAQDTKNKVAGVIEGTVAKFIPDMERTQTVKMPSKKIIEFAKNDIQNVLPQLEGNNKYNPKNALESNMRTFKSDTLENTLGRMFNWNDNLLEAEDALGLKSGYKKALAQYITANNIDINNITDKQLAKARNYAIKQAQERTFHQANAIASAINSFTRRNKVTKAIGDAILPFVKTPANVAKTGIEYSPVGLSKAIVYDTVQLRKGNININQYIDNLSKGLTGSAITVLGYALAQAGILKAGGSDDDEKEKFDEQSGKQAYSVQVGDKTYSIDWLAPVGIPLMVGAEIYEGLTQKSDEKTSKATDDEETLNKFLDRAEVLTNSLTSTLDPMVEMSMISGLVSSLKSFSQNSTEGISAMATNAAKSYINQYVPTLLGQIAKTTDTVERDTTSTKSGTLQKAIDSTINQVKSKIPGLRQTLPTRTDIWGEDQKLDNNWVIRFLGAGILPMNIKNVKNNIVVNELNNLYDKIGESSILPTTINKKVTIDGQDYRLTNEEYNKYRTMYGRKSYKLINELVSSDNYKKMTNIQKQTAIEEIYTYVKEQNKVDYSKNNKLNYEESTLSKVVNKLNGESSNYFEYRALTKDMKKDKEKIDILEKSSYSDDTKKVIYENSIGEDDETYSIMKKTNININEYLKYKQQDFSSDKKDDGTLNGKAVSNSKKRKVETYLNSMKITGNQRLLLYAMNGYSITASQKTQLANYVKDLKIDKEEKLKLYNKFSGFTVYKDGRVTW